MSIGFFIVGGLIFAVYIYLTVWNIFYSSKKQREENYPTLGMQVPTSTRRKKTIYVGKKVKETNL